MKILIQVQQKKYDLEKQAQLIVTELEKLNHTVEWSTQSHPARLLLNQYDLIYFITDSLPIKVKNFLLLLLAKSLQKPIVISTFETNLFSAVPNQLIQKQLQIFDALSTSEAVAIKNLRFFRQKKWILPIFPTTNIGKKNKFKKSTFQWVVPVFHQFQELLNLKNHLDESVVIDATYLKLKYGHIQIRRQWSGFIQQNPLFKKYRVMIEPDNLTDLNEQHKTAVQLNHLQLHPVLLADQIQKSLDLDQLLVLSESQASGLADFWRNRQNVIIHPNSSDTLSQDFDKIFENLDFSKNRHLLRDCLENKMNELNRLFVQLQQQKRAQLSYENMSYRS